MTTAATKLAHPTIQEIRENDGTSSSVREALYRLDNARETARADIARIEKERPGSLLTASASEIDRNDVRARQLRIFVEQMDTLEPELRRALGVAKEVEEEREYDAKNADLEAEIERWNADMRSQYDASVEPLIAFLQRERDIRGKCEAILDMPGYKRRFASHYLHTGQHPPIPHDLMLLPEVGTYLRSRPITFGELAQLPRLSGGEGRGWPAQ